MTATENLAEFLRTAPRTTIRVTEDEYNAFCELLERPVNPNPALILAMEKGRRLRESMQK